MPGGYAVIMRSFLLLLVSGLLLILLQAMPWNVLFPKIATLNLSFAFVIFVALYGPSLGSWFLAFMLGYALDTLSGCPAGLMTMLNLGALLFIRMSNRIMVFESLASQATLIFCLTASADFILLVVTEVATNNSLGFIVPGVLLKSVLISLLAIPLFAIYNKRRLSSEG
jgi:rod shape-determining protein MreD